MEAAAAGSAAAAADANLDRFLDVPFDGVTVARLGKFIGRDSGIDRSRDLPGQSCGGIAKWFKAADCKSAISWVRIPLPPRYSRPVFPGAPVAGWGAGNLMPGRAPWAPVSLAY